MMLLEACSYTFLASSAASALATKGHNLAKRDVSGTAHVYFGESKGPSQHYASGFIYGIPDTADQIPDSFYDEIDFKYSRAGGAQTLESRGWIGGLQDYKFRWESALSNYRTTRQHGGQFVLLVHDLWGADSTQPEDAPFPGDNGDWSSYYEFLAAVVSDMKDGNMIDGVTLDIWNEPDGANFWNREQDQYLQLWGRASNKFKSEFPDTPISGPSVSYPPHPDNSWWDAWAAYVVENESLPDEHSWHSLSKSDTTVEMINNYDKLLAKYGATRQGSVNLNEYGNPDEQTTAGSAWWIAQLERVNSFGCRANWASGYVLHDFMAQLLGNPGAGTDSYNATTTGYWPGSEYQVYKYYASTMTGDRVRTEATEDTNADVYVTLDSNTIRILAGARAITGTWYIRLENLSALGLSSSGSLDIHTYEFPGSSDRYSRVDETVDLGTSTHNYFNGSLSFPIFSVDVYKTWAFEIQI